MAQRGLCVLVICHDSPENVVFLAQRLRHPEIRILVHLDAKVDSRGFEQALSSLPNAVLIPERFDVRWGTESQLQAMAALLKQFALLDLSHFYFVSGHCVPVKPAEELLGALTSAELSVELTAAADNEWVSSQVRDRMGYYWIGDRKSTFTKSLVKAQQLLSRGRGLRRLVGDACFGSQWFGAGRRVALALLRAYGDEAAALRHTMCVDEIFFHTVIAREFPGSSNNGLMTYRDFHTGPDYPRWCNAQDYWELLPSRYVFARKFRGSELALLR